jgi:hypothetical protein
MPPEYYNARACITLGNAIKKSGKRNIIPYTCYEKSKKEYATPRDPKYSCYTKYVRYSRTYNIRQMNRIFFVYK